MKISVELVDSSSSVELKRGNQSGNHVFPFAILLCGFMGVENYGLGVVVRAPPGGGARAEHPAASRGGVFRPRRRRRREVGSTASGSSRKVLSRTSGACFPRRNLIIELAGYWGSVWGVSKPAESRHDRGAPSVVQLVERLGPPSPPQPWGCQHRRTTRTNRAIF